MGTGNRNESVGVAVLGLGRLGWRHAENLAWRVKGAQLVAVADMDRARLERATGTWPGVFASTDAAQAIGHPNVQAVVIATTTDTHAGLVEAAAAAGRHLFCEKPLAPDTASAIHACEAAERARVLLQVGLMRRFDAAYSRAFRDIQDGRIGRPLVFRSTSLDGVVSDSAAFLATCGGLLVDVALHDFDLAEWLVGRPVREVHATGTIVRHEVLRAYGDVDVAFATLHFEGGGLGSVYVSHCAPIGYDVDSQVIGERGALMAGSLLHGELAFAGDGAYERPVYRDFLDRFGPAYLAELEAFIEAASRPDVGPVPMGADGRAGVRALAVALAARRSLASGGRERPDDVLTGAP